MSDTRTPLSKAQGFGASGGHAHSWWLQRLTSIALLPLVLWFGFSLASQPSLAVAPMQQWIAQPLNTMLMVALVISACWHAALGCRVIIEDYVHTEPLKISLLIFLDFALWLLAISGVLALIKISL